MKIKQVFLVTRSLVISLILLSFLVLPPAGWADTPDPGKWKQFINQDNIYDLALDGDHLWVGINGGLKVHNLSFPEVQRYYHRLNSGLNAGHVYSVALDAAGKVWLGTENGVFYLDQNDDWVLLDKDNSPLTVNSVRVVVIDEQEGIWFGTWGGGVFHRDRDNNWQQFDTGNSPIPGNRINTLALEAGGGVWIGTDGRGVGYLSPGGEWEVFNARNSSLAGNDILDIEVDGTGGVWLATYQGLVHLDSQREWQVYNTANSSLPANMVYSLALETGQGLWAGVEGNLVQLAPGNEWQIFPVPAGTAANRIITKIALDSRGQVWVGMLEGGSLVFDPAQEQWRQLGHDKLALAGRAYLPANTVNSVFPLDQGDRTTIFFGTGQQLSAWQLQGKKWESIELGENRQVPVNKITGDQGDKLVIATDGLGVIIWGPGGVEEHYRMDNSQLPSNGVTGGARDNLGGLWVTTLDGGVAYLAADGSWTVYNEESGHLPVDNINDVLIEAAGSVWFGTWGEGLVKFAPDGSRYYYHAGNSALPSNDLSEMVEDAQGMLWFATWGGGLARYEPGTEGWSVFNTENSDLPGNIVRSVAVDARGWLWSATSAGVGYYDGGQWHQLSPESTGLPVDQVWRVAGDSLGNVWLATLDSGVLVYNPDGLPPMIREAQEISQRFPEIMLYLDNRYVEPDVAPVVETNRTLVPTRSIFEAIGAAVQWDDALRQVDIRLDNGHIRLVIDDTKAYVNGEPVELDVPARIINNRMMVPLRFVISYLGLRVDWDPVLRAVIMTTQDGGS